MIHHTSDALFMNIIWVILQTDPVSNLWEFLWKWNPAELIYKVILWLTPSGEIQQEI